MSEKNVAADFAWDEITFGQSTDVDFNSTILPEKYGVNYVYRYNKSTNRADANPLRYENPKPTELLDVAIEARGGKLAQAHDGLTFYYTQIPTSQNFVLTGTINVEQMGPEDGGSPNFQEGAGIMVRDVIGTPRLEELEEGFEEYPAASNMAAIWIDGSNKTAKDSDLEIRWLSRYGTDERVGTSTAVRSYKGTDWLNGVDSAKAVDNNDGSSIPDRSLANKTLSNRYQCKLVLQMERTDETFIMRMLDPDTKAVVKELNFAEQDSNIHANIVAHIEPSTMYAGFYASRNARISVSDIELTVSQANTEEYPPYEPINTEDAKIYRMSPDSSAGDQYALQLMTNYDGQIKVILGPRTEVTSQVKAGEVYRYDYRINASSQEAIAVFTIDDDIQTTGERRAQEHFRVALQRYQDMDLYSSPDAVSGAAGTQASPMPLEEAVLALQPGRTLYLMPGTYKHVSIPLAYSGLQDKPKTMKALGDVVIAEDNADNYLLTLDADYWIIEGIEVDGREIVGSRGIYIYGSNNIVRNCVAHSTKSDAGICITSHSMNGGNRFNRALWPHDNLVENCYSYNHRDASLINADGFAAKSGSGDNNTFRYCVAHDNADDGWDLFNKLDEGKNGTTIIENCIAYNNGNNGFKLGGESLEVRHIVTGCVSYNNRLDGFTDNFNPGDLMVKNNTSFNNTRYNYIFRRSPYNTHGADGTKINNVSYRTDIKPSTYDDKIYGETVENNFLIADQSTTLTANDFVSLDTNQAYTWEDGQLVFGNFLRAKQDSILTQSGAGALFE